MLCGINRLFLSDSDLALTKRKLTSKEICGGTSSCRYFNELKVSSNDESRFPLDETSPGPFPRGKPTWPD